MLGMAGGVVGQAPLRAVVAALDWSAAGSFGAHSLRVSGARVSAKMSALSARVGSISDNRLGGWYGYRASKAALNMLIKTLAIEIAPRRPEAICVGLHPGTVDTDLSQPFQRGVAREKLFTPAQSAAHLLAVIDR